MDRPGELNQPSQEGDPPKWERVAVFAAALEADLARQILEAEDIPVAILQDQTGIFGPGFAGASPLGVTVLVPADRADDAKGLLADTMEAFGGDAPEEE